MDYQQLEDARLALKNKRKKVSDIIIKIYLGIISIVILTKAIAASVGGADLDIQDLLFSVIFFFIQLSIISLVVAAIITFIATGKEATAYHTAYKSYFVSKTLNKVFTDLTYNHNSGMPYTNIANTRMMKMGDRYSSNDYVSAKYKGYPFSQADVHIEEEHSDSDGGSTYTTIFRGRWVTFDTSKRFEKRLLVEGKHFGCAKVKRSDNFQKIKLESAEFNKNFNVLAQDGFEAFYLLDPAIMERIQRLSDLHNGRVMVCFSDNKIHIAINNNIDSFEPPSANKPIDEQKEFDKVMNDIKVVTNIVDELKLVK